MAQDIVQAKFVTPDGAQFDTKGEAQDHLRKPVIMTALNKVNGDNAELTEWLFNNRDDVAGVFESTKIQRVTKAEKAQLVKSLEAVTKAHATVTPGAAEGDAPVVTNIEKGFAFLIENAQAIADSFRWPSVKRVSEEDQATTIKAGFMTLTGDNAELSDWIIANKDALLEAFEAGKVKREVSPKAAQGLAEYQARQKAAKLAAEAAKAAEAK